MARYLRHFALVMILEDRGLTVSQMQSVLGLSSRLIEEYRGLYQQLNTPAHERALERLKCSVYVAPFAEPAEGEKGGPR
jgi:hypothetical protein